MAVEIYITIEF